MAKFLIVGAGKVAKHLNHYLRSLDLTVTTWDRAQDPHLLRTKLEESTHVLLAISDGAIESFYRKHLAGLDKTVVHFSGALNVDGVIAAHPLMTFGPDLYSEHTYAEIHFVLTGCQSLQEALPGLKNSSSVLPPEKKALYHALCVMGGNFPVILWQKMLLEFEKFGITNEDARIYLETCLQNTLRHPLTALTGPLARKDKVTVTKNLEALAGDPFQQIYLAFAQTIAPETIEEKERSL